MKFSIVFVFALCVLAAFLGQTEARWKGWKKVEDAGKRVFRAAEKALPVVQGYAGPVAAVAAVVGKK